MCTLVKASTSTGKPPPSNKRLPCEETEPEKRAWAIKEPKIQRFITAVNPCEVHPVLLLLLAARLRLARLASSKSQCLGCASITSPVSSSGGGGFIFFSPHGAEGADSGRGREEEERRRGYGLPRLCGALRGGSDTLAADSAPSILGSTSSPPPFPGTVAVAGNTTAAPGGLTRKSAGITTLLSQTRQETMLPFVLLLPVLIVLAAGIYYVYNEFLLFMSNAQVRNKVVVLTDAVSGVGSELSRLFHQGGARLILCGTSWDKLESLYDTLSTDADPRETFAPKLVLVDFSDPDSLEGVVAEVVDCYGYVDVLICNSSIKIKGPVQSISLEVDRNIMDINYFGPCTLAKGVLPSMMSRRNGQIVLVNSIHGRLAVPFRSSYAASKHAAQAFFDCLRAEVEEYGVSVSTISHTFINASEPAPATESAPQPPASAYSRLRAYVLGQLSHGVRPSVLAHEVLQTVNRRKKEVLLSHPLPRAALYVRSLLPPVLFSVLSAGVRDNALAEHIQ
ncbi:hypothetical protein WMY93_010042 [Mugilogobius chulae]|uniref:Dehydrogenase/reductase SDR family member 7C n=1 Tax=Mugilogobius chulae TaxID=88201 RepID=A0AAW0P6E7_9GOBI